MRYPEGIPKSDCGADGRRAVILSFSALAKEPVSTLERLWRGFFLVREPDPAAA